MQKCPVEGCGRQFQNEQTMVQHFRRRHPQHFQQTKNKLNKQVLQNNNKIQEELIKLPKVNKIIQISKEKKQIQFHRRSTSKNRKQLSTLINNQSKVSQIITQSRQLVQQHSKKILKRPSLSKKQSISQVNQEKLPTINSNKIVKRSKLELIRSEIDKNSTIQTSKQLIIKKSSQTSQDFYSTAPHFAKKLSSKHLRQPINSRSKGKQSKIQSTQKQGELQAKLANSLTSKELIKPVQEQEKKKLVQRPLKRFLDRKKVSSSQIRIQKQSQKGEDLCESLYIEQKPKTALEIDVDIKPALSFKQKPINQKNEFSDQKMNIGLAVDWQQRILSLRNQKIKHFIVPSNARVQFIFANNCGIQNVNLNDISTLVELSMTNNSLSHIHFLDYCQNFNLTMVYFDHNSITSLEGLPYHIKKAQLSFNKISGLEEVVKILYRCKDLQELDLSFNPIRKQANYKVAVVAACKKLKKLDGMKITKFDKELACDYRKILDQQNQIIPLNGFEQKQQQKWRPSTAVSIAYQDQLQSQGGKFSQKQLTQQIKTLQRIVKQTKEQYEIIKEQNEVLTQQLDLMNKKYESRQVQNVDVLYNKLQKECQQLQMLNFLQYADQEQLEQLLSKKLQEYGVEAF